MENIANAPDRTVFHRRLISEFINSLFQFLNIFIGLLTHRFTRTLENFNYLLREQAFGSHKHDLVSDFLAYILRTLGLVVL